MTTEPISSVGAQGAHRPRPYDPNENWPEPDPRLNNGGAVPAPPFPIECMGAVGPFALGLAQSRGSPIDYVAVPLLVFAAGVVGGARSVGVRRGWVEGASLWGMMVGAPSSGKSPPLTALKRALAAVERDAGADLSLQRREHEARKIEAQAVRERWENAAKSAANAGREALPMPEAAEEPPEPKAPRLAIGDVTTEKLARLIADNQRGLVMIRDELAGLIGNFGKYGGEDAPFYLSAYSGDFSPVDRVKGGTITAPAARLSIVGGIQPDKVQALLAGRANDGLVARFLCVWPDRVRRVWDVPAIDEDEAEALLSRLWSLAMNKNEAGELSPRVLPLSSEAAEIFAAWWQEQGAKAAEASGFMAEFLGKSDGTCARVALVLELLDWAATKGGPKDGPDEVSADAVERACQLFDDYFEPMARRVYADAALPEVDRKAIALLKEIKRRKVRTFNVREVYRGEKCWRLAGLAQANDVEAACAVLSDADCIAEAERTPGALGRPAKNFVVNPRLFAKGAARE